MRINTHCHIFTIRSIYTETAKEAIRARIINEGFTKAMADVVVKLLDGIIQGVVTTGESQRQRKRIILEAMRDQGVFDQPGYGFFRGRSLDHMLLQLDEWGLTSDLDAASQNIFDYIGFVDLALFASVDEIADRIVEAEPSGDVIVPLMMDLYAPSRDEEAAGREQEQFDGQVADMKRQVLRYPGRVLPFYAVHPNRPGCLEGMVKRLEEGAFVGVKLYPSLGYKVTSPEMLEMLEYLDEHGYPVMMHCNTNGFKVKNEYAEYCSPEYWRGILDDTDRLKICFGHFGGDDYFVGHDDQAAVGWTKTILGFMRDESFGNRVFADISYHDGPMQSAGKAGSYAEAIRGLFADDRIKSQVLWGSDYYMIRMRVREGNYWRFFSRLLSQDDVFQRISEQNPLQYLGLNPADPEENIARHIGFFKKNRSALNQGNMAGWLRDIWQTE